ncbi:MAG: response regulator [Desulfobacterales bacterium]|nr:response regulator [Desulfobacterales bacterium]
MTAGRRFLFAFEIQKEKIKIALVVILISTACFLTYYFHVVLKLGTVFTHFFYIPIILACLWWKKKGLAVALFLAAFLVFSHIFPGSNVLDRDDGLRALMFVVVASVVIALSEKLDKSEEALRESEEKYRLVETCRRQSQKMEAIGTLAGGIAHDFNNILAAVLGYVELAKDDVPEGSPAQASLEEVFRAANRAKGLVKQILAFSRQREQERKPLQVSPIVKEALKLLRASLPTTIEIRQYIKTESGTVLADPTDLHQMLMNLCTNAAYAMRNKVGMLEVSLVDVDLPLEVVGQAHPSHLPPGAYLRLSVKDTGHGMERSVIERIFDPFFTTKERGEGTGIGLAAVHGIVESHGGGITVDSEPGKGATFKVFLPRLETGVTPETEILAPIYVGNERILFVDDEQTLVNMGRPMLERLGYKVVASSSSIEALEIFRADPDRFDLVITDETMPHMTGARLAKELIRIRPDIPIILCTGFSEVMTADKAMAIGIQEFVMKPIVRREMAETIRRVLDQAHPAEKSDFEGSWSLSRDHTDAIRQKSGQRSNLRELFVLKGPR